MIVGAFPLPAASSRAPAQLLPKELAMRMLVAAVFTLCAVLQPACSADRAAECSSAGGSSSTSNGSDGCDVVMCKVTSTFPMFDKTCTSASDCVIGVHQTDCCGSTQAIGMNEAEQARFTADETTCVAQYAMCGCPAYFTVAEDGQRATDGKTIVVECQSSQCMTAVR
jgi:hypothetical protein